MNKELKIKIVVDSHTKQLKVIQDDLGKLGGDASSSAKSVQSLTSTIKTMGHVGAGIYGTIQAFGLLDKTLGSVVKTGIEYNRTFENLTNKLTTLSIITTKFKDGTDTATKYAYAQQQANEAISELIKINAETPHNLSQTIELYGAMYPSMKQANVSMEQMVDLTKKLSIATSGMEFNSVLAGIDGLANGTVLANSEFGRFLNALGLTNEELKKSTNIYETINDKLKDVQGFETLDTALSNLQNSWNDLTSTLTKPLFDTIKEQTINLGEYLKTNKNDLVGYVDTTIEVGKQLAVVGGVMVGTKIALSAYSVALVTARTMSLNLLQASLLTAGGVKVLNTVMMRFAPYAAMAGITLIFMNWDKLTKSVLHNMTQISDFELNDRIKKQEEEIKRRLEQKELNKSGGLLGYIGANWTSKDDAELRLAKQRLMELNKELEKRKTTIKEFDYKDIIIDENNALNVQILTEEELAKLEAERLRLEAERLRLLDLKSKAYLELATVGMSDYEQKLLNINLKVQEWINSGVEIEDALNAQNMLIKQLDDAELEKLNKGLDYTKNSIMSLHKETKNWLDTLLDGFDKAMNSQIFDALSGKFDSASIFFKDFGNSIKESIFRGTASLMSSNLSTALKLGIGVTAPTFTSASDASSWLQSNSSLFSDEGYSNIANSINDGNFKNLQLVGNLNSIYSLFTSGVTGVLTSTGTALMNIGTALQSTTLANLGAGSYLWGSGVGSSVLSGATLSSQIGYYGTGMAVGGIGGYALGTLGDSLFGAETRAGNYGATAGAIGGMIAGPVGALAGAVLGSVIGGIFGNTKITGSGLYTKGTKDANNILNFTSYQEKSWFGSDSWVDFSPLSQRSKKSIQSVFDSYNYLFESLGDFDSEVGLKKGFYTISTFQNQLAKSFISGFMNISEIVTSYISTNLVDSSLSLIEVTKKITKENPVLKEIFTSWKEYAKTINKTVQEALTQSVSEFVSYKRDFEVYALRLVGKDTEALKYQMDFLKADYDLLANTLNANGVTIENFTQKMNEALKKDFTPTTLQHWQHLGNMLKDLTDVTNNYNQALESQKQSLIEQTTQLNSTLTLMALDKYGFDLEIKNYKDKLKDLAKSATSTFIGTLKPLIDGIKSLKDMTLNSFDMLGNQDIGKFWELDNKFKENLQSGNIEEAKRVYQNLINVANNINDADGLLGGNLREYFEANLNQIELADKTIKVEIVGGLSELIGLNETQKTELANLVKNETLSYATLDSIKSLNSDQKNELTSILESNGLLSKETTLSSLDVWADLQLKELKKLNADQTKDLSEDTFKYLASIGTKEQYDIALLLGKTFQEVEPLIYTLQSFDIKDSVADVELLKNMLNYQLVDGKSFYNESVLNDLVKLKDVLPSDIKEAYHKIFEESYLLDVQSMLRNNLLNTQSVGKIFQTKYTSESFTVEEFEKLIRFNELQNLIDKNINFWHMKPNLKKWEDELIKIDIDKESANSLLEHLKNLGTDKISYETTKEVITKINQDFLNYSKSVLDLLIKDDNLNYSKMPSFDVGTSYVQRDMTANIHKGEIIIDPQSSDVLRKYGININQNSSLEEKFEKLLELTQKMANAITSLAKTNKNLQYNPAPSLVGVGSFE